MKNRLDNLVLGLVVAVTLLALFASQIAPFDANQPSGALALPPLSSSHWLGTDSIGRDILSRTLMGVRASWFSALAVVLVGLLFGGAIGVAAGVNGGWVDDLLMRLTDLFLALPSTLVAIAIVAALGHSLQNTLIGISLVWWPYYARIVRGEVKAIMARPHIEAARLAHCGPMRLVLFHVLPGVLPAAVVAASLDIGNVVVVLAGLSFLGLGQAAPTAELGADTARNLQFLLSKGWIPIIPGMAVLLLSLLASLAGDAVRRRLLLPQ
jgi:peptide/nickel transport system permease protein